MTLDGKVLWQLGRPDPRNGLLTNDTPFQIHDLDGDGKNEVVMVHDFQLQVLEGRNGQGAAASVDAGGAARQQGAAVRDQQRRLDRVPQLSGGQAARRS